MTRTFYLGPAILKLDDSAHVPDIWREALLRALGGPGRASVGLTCKAALQYLTAEWPGAELQVAVRAPSPDQIGALLRRSHAARSQLEQRRSKPTILTLVQRGRISAADTWWGTLGAALATGQPIPGLALSLQLAHIPQALITFWGQALPQLATLTLGPLHSDGFVQLPAPSTLPALQHLTLNRTVDWPTLAPYLPQLVSLSLGQVPDYGNDEAHMQPARWWHIFSAATHTTTLRRLSVPCILEPFLVRLLQKHVPLLEQLGVTRVASIGAAAVENLESNEGVAPVCSWRHLTIGTNCGVHELAWLPLPATGKLVIEPLTKQIRMHAVLSDTVVAKLASVEYTACDELCIAALQVPVADQVAALTNTLTHLTHLRTPTTRLALLCFELTPAFAAAVGAAAAAGWRSFELSGTLWDPMAFANPLPALRKLGIGELNDGMLSQVIAHVPSLEMLSVRSIRLTAPLPQGTRVPWRVIRVWDRVQLSDWVGQAELVGSSTAWQLDVLNLSLTHAQVTSGAHRTLAERLQHIRFEGIGTLHVSGADCWDPIPSQPSVLRACLSVASALPCEPKTISLDTWQANEALVYALRHLPHWRRLSLSLTPLEDADIMRERWPIARAPWFIPRSYQQWCLPGCLGHMWLDPFLFNAPGDRTSKEPLSIVVDTPRQAAELMMNLETDGSYSYVGVVPPE